MSKKTLLANIALASTITAIGAVGTNKTVHADASRITDSTNVTSDDQQLVKLKQAQVAKEQALAEQNKQELANDTAKANTQLTDLNNQLTQQKQAVDDSNQQMSQVKIDQETALKNESARYSQAVQNQQEANRQALVNAQKNVVTPAQKNAQSKQAAADYQHAQQHLKSQEDAENAKVQSEYTKQKQALNDKIASIQAENDARGINAEITSVSKQALSAKSNVDSASQKLEKAKQTNDQAVEAEQKIQAELDAVKNHQALTRQTLTVYNPQGYLKAFNRGIVNGMDNQLNNDEAAVINRIWDDNWQNYRHDPQLMKESVDPNNLTIDQQKRLTLYAVDLLNQLRKQLGLPLLVVTKGSFKFALDVAKEYNDDRWAQDDWHDCDGISRAAIKNGLSGDFPLTTNGVNQSGNPAKYAQQFYEDKGEWMNNSHGNAEFENGEVNGGITYFEGNKGQALFDQDTTMDTLEFGIYQMILEMFLGINRTPMPAYNKLSGNEFGGREFEHAAGLLGHWNSIPDLTGQSFGLVVTGPTSPKDLGSFAGNSWFEIHFLTVSPQYITNPSLFNSTIINDSTEQGNFEALTKAHGQAQIAADKAGKALIAAKKAFDDVDQLYQQITDKVAQLQTKRVKATSVHGGIAEEQANSLIKALQAQLNQLTVEYQAKLNQVKVTYQKKQDEIRRQYQEKLKVIEGQPSDVEALKASQAKALADLKMEHEARVKKINSDAQTKLSALQKELSIEHDNKNKSLLDQIQKIKEQLAKESADLTAKLAQLVKTDALEYQTLKTKLMRNAVVKGKTNELPIDKRELVILPSSLSAPASSAVKPAPVVSAAPTSSASAAAKPAPVVSAAPLSSASAAAKPAPVISAAPSSSTSAAAKPAPVISAAPSSSTSAAAELVTVISAVPMSSASAVAASVLTNSIAVAFVTTSSAPAAQDTLGTSSALDTSAGSTAPVKLGVTSVAKNTQQLSNIQSGAINVPNPSAPRKGNTPNRLPQTGNGKSVILLAAGMSILSAIAGFLEFMKKQA